MTPGVLQRIFVAKLSRKMAETYFNKLFIVIVGQLSATDLRIEML